MARGVLVGLIVEGSGPRRLRLTAELADHWDGALVLTEEISPLLRLVDEACRTAGGIRNP